MNDPQAEVEARAEVDGLHHYPVAFLQHLIETGEGWKWEGAISQAVVRALEDGTCVLGTMPHRDYHNNVVPSRGELPPGEKGTLAYANRLRAERGAPALVEAADGTVTEAT